MSRFPSFIDPNRIPEDKEEALQLLESQATFGLLWYQCFSGIDFDSMRVYKIQHAVLRTIVLHWNSDELSVIYNDSFLADIIIATQDRLLNSFVLYDSFVDDDRKEDVLVVKPDILDDKLNDFRHFMRSHNNGKRRRQERNNV